jgi:site-specific DNA-cytosine methylase
MTTAELLESVGRPTLGSLFSGAVDGLALGVERATGADCRWQVEIDDWCNFNLARHWPRANRTVRNVSDAGAHNLERVHVIVGGFPCTDISFAGDGGAGDVHSEDEMRVGNAIGQFDKNLRKRGG